MANLAVYFSQSISCFAKATQDKARATFPITSMVDFLVRNDTRGL